MSDNGGGQIRVILRWIQIKDNKEAMWDDEGEFRFRSKVTSGDHVQELEFPEQGYGPSRTTRGATRSTRSTRFSTRARTGTT